MVQDRGARVGAGARVAGPWGRALALQRAPVLRVFEPKTRALVPLAGAFEGGWLHVSDPTPDEVTWLERQVGVPPMFLPHALDVDEVARVDRDGGGAVLVMVRAPLHQGPGHDLPYRSTSLALVISGPRLITIARREPPVIDVLRMSPGLDPARPHRFILQLVFCLAESFLVHLRRLDADVDRLEDELQASLRNQAVLALLKLQKGLVHFTTALKSDEILLERLEADPPLEVAPEDRALLEDAQVELRQAIETSRVTSEILGNMMDAFASIISNNLNVVMKVMTALMIVISIPATLAAFYGMNVALPGQAHPWAFAGIVAASATVAVAVLWVFRRRQWL